LVAEGFTHPKGRVGRSPFVPSRVIFGAATFGRPKQTFPCDDQSFKLLIKDKTPISKSESPEQNQPTPLAFQNVIPKRQPFKNPFLGAPWLCA
jgi:hypothetical protein